MLATLLLSTFLTTAQPPNIIVILTDDQGWGDLSLHGNKNLNTPHIDSIAKNGASFTQFFVQPVCSPTRAEFLTGRYHPRSGVRNVTSGGERMNLNEKTIADSLRNSGYRTALFGKWHNGSQYPYHPNGRGFEEYYGFTSGHWGDYFDAPLEHNGKDVMGKGFICNDLTNRTIDFITTHRSKPFFCCLTYNAPHSPMQVPDPYWKKFESFDLKNKGATKEDANFTRAALAMVENLDDNIGRLLASLKTNQLDSNTIVVYFHDNGPNSDRWNNGMKGRKGSTDEGGTRSPLFVRWPGQIQAGMQVNNVAGSIDLLPTLLELAKVSRVGDLPIDGVSFAKALTTNQSMPNDRIIFNHWNSRTSARSETHRLDHEGKLFRVSATDGSQAKSIDDDPATKKKLADAVAAWRSDVLKDLKQPDSRPFTVGYAAFPRTVLPARDGKPLGGIKRSANAPNCSFFTNWTKPDDAMTWPIEIAEVGKYEAVVDYTIPETHLGTEIQLSVGEQSWKGTFRVAHDPPLKGMEHDRVKRAGESYVKEFKPLSMGTLDLKPGTFELKLTATKIPGRGVADIRRIVLTKR